MADKKISELDPITGATVAADDVFVVVDTSGGVTRKITHDELKIALALGDTPQFNQINMADDAKILLGNSDDLEIYHDGSNSIIREGGTGGLRIQTNGSHAAIMNGGATETMARFNNNGSVDLFYNNAEKLATTDTGIDVTGTATMDGLTVDGDVNISDSVPILRLDSPAVTWSGGEDLGGIGWYTEDTSGSGPAVMARIYSESTGANSLPIPNMIFQTSLADVALKDRMKIAGNGDVSLYEDTGSDVKFFWDASAESLGIGTTSPSKQLHQIRTGSASDLPTLSVETGFITQSTNSTASSQNISIMSGNIGEGRLFFGDTDDEDVGKIVYNHTSNYMAFDTGGSESMRIDASGNVSLSGGAIVGAGSSSAPSITASNDTDAGLFWGGGFLGFTGGSSNQMRLDNSGNLLVGKTTTAIGTQGIRLEGNNGKIEATRSGNVVTTFNRTGSDGTISEWMKDGTTVGSIFSSGGIQMGIGDGDTGLLFGDNIDAIMPWSTSNSQRDAVTDLGRGATRFKDLYLSGGVYLGGTGAANYLDDYEEGTYTVQLFDASSGGNASSSSTTGTYTKIGNLVTCKFYALNNINTTGMTGANDLSFSLPFAASSTGRSAGSVVFDNLNFISGRTMIVPLVLNNEGRGQFHTTGDSVSDQITEVQEINSGSTDIHTFTLTYTTA